MKISIPALSSCCFVFLSAALTAADLPSGYSEIPYLQSDGTAWIDTKYCPNEKTRLEAEYDVKDMDGDHYLFGSSDNPTRADRALWVETYGNDGGYIGVFGVNYISKSSGSLSLSKTEYKSCSFAYAAGRMEIVNTTDGKTAVYDASAKFDAVVPYQSQSTFAIFTRKHIDGSVRAQNNTLRIRGFRIWEGDELVRNLVPAYEEATVQLGLYDLANDEFYPNAATSGTFSTEVTGSRKRLAYLGGTGTQYIDTGYVFKTRPRVECHMYLNTTGDLDVMGNAAAQAGCFIVDYNDGTKTIYYRYGNSNGNASMSSSYPQPLKGKWTSAVYDTTVTHDGVQVGSEVTSFDFSSNKQTFQLFRGRTSSQVRFSYVRIYDGNTLVRDYIPAEVDGTVGLWDRLTQTMAENAGEGSFEAGCAIPAQPGDFSVLEVVGSPDDLGSVSPAYGQHAAVPGETAVCTAVAPDPTETERVSLAGWEVYKDGVFETSGLTSPASFTCGEGLTTLKWLWGGEFYVSFAAGAHGSVTNTTGWYASGATVPVLAVPDDGCEFICWKGVPAGQERLNPLPFVVDGARTIEAVFTSSQAKRLEYIGSTALQQYINTEYVFTNRPAVVARMMMMDTADTDFMGTGTAAADCFIVDYSDGSAKLYYRYAAEGNTPGDYAGTSGKLGGKWFDCAWSNIVWHGSDKVLDLSANDYTGRFASNKQPFYLFHARKDRYGKVRFASVRMYDGEALVRDFIPAKLGGVAVLWDRVERKPYRNAKGVSPFEEGPTVPAEPGDFAASHSVSAGEGGTAEASDLETPLGETITLTATPAAGYAFAGWVGNIPASFAASATATFAVPEPLDVQATFVPDRPYVVDPAGGGDFTSLDEAVAALAGKSGTLIIKGGTYAVANTLVISGGLTLKPESGRLGDVTIGAKGDFTAVELSHPLSRLSNLVISNGYTASSTKGGNVTMSAGIVEGCLITAGRMEGGASVAPAAAGVYMTGGVLRDSVIRGNVTVGDNGGAVGVYAKGSDALVENCDVSCNTNLMNYQLVFLVHSGGIKLDGGTVRNCFVTNNVNLGHGNLYVTGGGRVEDTVVADNVGGFYFDTLSGGGFVPANGSATFIRTTFARNSGYGVGGLYVGGTVSLTGVKAYGNRAARGGTDGNMDVRGCPTAGIDFTNPDERPVTRVADVYLPDDTTDIREAVRRCADNGTVHVAAGAYSISGEVIVDRPIRIVGAGADTTSFYRDPSALYTRLFNLRHAEAVLEGVAVSNGQRLAANAVNVFRGTLRQGLIADIRQECPCVIWNGGTVRDTRFTRSTSPCSYSAMGTVAYLAEAGAVLEDCLIEGNEQQNSYPNHLVRVDGGRISRCVFRDNRMMGGESCCVSLAGPCVVESSLLTHNDGSWYSGAGFFVNGSGWEVRNCTVVSNLSEYGGAAVYWLTNNNNTATRRGSFANCIFYRNRCTKEQHLENFDIAAGNGTKNIDVTFRNCLFTTAEAAAAQGERAVNPLSGDPKFRDLSNRDYRLGPGSPCRNAGYVWEGADDPSVTDLNGRRLSQFGLIDVGCYASNRNGLTIIVR